MRRCGAHRRCRAQSLVPAAPPAWAPAWPGTWLWLRVSAGACARGNAARRAPANAFAACGDSGAAAAGGDGGAAGGCGAGFGAGGEAGGAGAGAGAGGATGGGASASSPSPSISTDGATGLPMPPASMAAAHTGVVAMGGGLGCWAAGRAAGAALGEAAQRLQNGTPSFSCSRPGTAGLSLQPHCAHARQALCHSPGVAQGGGVSAHRVAARARADSAHRPAPPRGPRHTPSRRTWGTPPWRRRGRGDCGPAPPCRQRPGNTARQHSARRTATQRTLRVPASDVALETARVLLL